MNDTSRPLSIAGTPAARPSGYYWWTSVQAARDPLYIMIIIYIYFPYFSNEVVGDPVKGQTLIGYINSSAGFLAAISIPFLGAIADKIGTRKPWIVASHLIIATCAFSLWFVLPGAEGFMSLPITFMAILTMVVFFGYSEVFHNAMLPNLTPKDKVGLVSGLAFSVGNCFAIFFLVYVLYAFALPGTQDWSFLPEKPLFGLDQAMFEQDRIVAPIAAVWLILATIPFLLITPDGKPSSNKIIDDVKTGLGDVIKTIRSLNHYKNIGIYLLARMLFNDGMVGVLVFNGVYASGVFGWDSVALLLLGICTSGSAMVGAYFGGMIDDRLGSLATLKISIAMTTLILLTLVSIKPGVIFFVFDVGTDPVWAFPYMNTIPEIIYFVIFQVFALFFVTGLSASRTLMAKLSPSSMATQFFGLYSLSGTVTQFLAPLMVATTTAWFDSQRAGFSSLIILMVAGMIGLFWVREEQATPAPD